MPARRPHVKTQPMSVGDWIDAIVLIATLGLVGVVAHASGLSRATLALPVLTVAAGMIVIIPAIVNDTSSVASIANRPWVVAPVVLAPATAIATLGSLEEPPYLVVSVALGLVAIGATIVRIQMLVARDNWRSDRETDLIKLSSYLVSVESPEDAKGAALETIVRMTQGQATASLVDISNEETLAVRNASLSSSSGPSNNPKNAEGARQSFELTGLDPNLQLVVCQPKPIGSRLEYWIQTVADHLARTLYALDYRRQQSERHVNERFEALAQDSSDLIALIDPDTLLVRFIGPTLNRLLGYAPEDYIGAPLLQHVAIDDLKTGRKTVQRSTQRKKGSRCDLRVKTADGSYRWFTLSARYLEPPNDQPSGDTNGSFGQLVGVLVNLSDIHERKMAEFLVRRAETRYRALVEKSTDVFALVTRDLTIDYISPNVKQLSGYDHVDLLGGPLIALFSPESAEGLHELTSSTYLSEEGSVIDIELLTASGKQLPAQLSVHHPDPTEHGGLLMIMRDVSARRSLEENLRSRNLFDQLTGLMTRPAFEVELRRRVERNIQSEFAAASTPTIGVITLDIRAFKEVNNSAGFEAGNELLVQFAQRLTQTVRDSDDVARFAVDEFAILTEAQDDDQLQNFAERLRNRFSEPFSINGRTWKVSIAIGMATTNIVGTNPVELLQAAHLARSQAKQSDQQGVSVYSRTMKDQADERFELMSDMDAAVNQGDFYVAYQPLIALQTQAVSGFEALLRWTHPNRGNISPATFIPLAEQSGLIIDLGRWVMRESCRQLLEWRTGHEGYQNTTVAVNMSARQLEGDEELDNLIRVIEATGLDFSSLTVELTESIVIEDAARFRSQLNQLRKLGTRIAVDDFGTGASGLNHLREFPFDIVKIDRSYTNRVGVGGEGEHLVGQLIELAKGLNAISVAEGIESQLQAEILTQMGCDIGQGFHLAKPMEAKRIVPWMQARREGIITS